MMVDKARGDVVFRPFFKDFCHVMAVTSCDVSNKG
jgi:hypothetical protein